MDSSTGMSKPTLIYRNGEWVPEDLPEIPGAETQEKPNLIFQGGEWVPEEIDFSAAEMMRNVPESASEAGSQFVSALGEIPKSMKNVFVRSRGGVPDEPSLDAIIADPSILAEMPGQVVDYVQDRYGGIERFQRSLQEDPVGTFLDLTAAAGGGLKGAQSLGRLGRSLAENTYSRLAKFSTTIPWKDREKLIRTALDEGLYPTRSGLQKIENRMDILGHQIDEIISSAQAADELIPVDMIFRYMDDLRSTKGGMRIEATDDLSKINKIERKLRERFSGPNANVTKVRPAELQAIKTDIYDKAYKKERSRIGQGKVPENTKTQAYRELGRGAKEALEDVVPEISDVNRQWGELSDLRTPLTQASNRLENRNWLGLTGSLLGGGAGAMGGGMLGGSAGAAGGSALGALAASLALSPMAQRQFIRVMNQSGGLRNMPDVPGLAPAAGAAAFTMPGRIEDEE